jgi:predicted nucleic acid-binding protein
MPSVVVDTHAILWYLTGDSRLSKPAMESLDAATAGGDPIYVPAICAALLSLATNPNELPFQRKGTLVVGYLCDGCQRSIPVRWKIDRFNSPQPVVSYPEEILRAEEPFDWAHLPDAVAKEIKEGLLLLTRSLRWLRSAL